MIMLIFDDNMLLYDNYVIIGTEQFLCDLINTKSGQLILLSQLYTLYTIHLYEYLKYWFEAINTALRRVYKLAGYIVFIVASFKFYIASQSSWQSEFYLLAYYMRLFEVYLKLNPSSLLALLILRSTTRSH